MTDQTIEEVRDINTNILETMIFGTICGIVVCIDKVTGEKYYGLRVSKRSALSDPNKTHDYAIWFLRDFKDSGAGGFQIQKLD